MPQIPGPHTPNPPHTTLPASPHPISPHLAPPRARPLIEALVFVSLGVALARTFLVEAYVVPSGSMAPTLLGMHRQVVCLDCGFPFAVGVDDAASPEAALCPNCGLEAQPRYQVLEGDRLLVHKRFFDLRPPRRWEVAVFEHPVEPGQVYVKRIVGLPGESVQIRRGDVLINGRLARKSWRELQALRQPVYRHDHPPPDAPARPRWIFRRGSPNLHLDSGWTPVASSFSHQPRPLPAGAIDWLEYRHWRPDLPGYGPIRDFHPYNGARVPGQNAVTDLILAAEIRILADCPEIHVAFRNASLAAAIPTAPGRPVSLWIGGNRLELTTSRPDRAPLPDDRAPHLLEAALVDHRLHIRVDGRPIIPPWDAPEDSLPQTPAWDRPLALGVPGPAAVEVARLAIDRDVYYADHALDGPTHARATREPIQLGPDEYFVLGDNSLISNDSRFWPENSALKANLLVGKPFLVHLPGWALAAGGLGAVPDPRAIRYIR
jgi:signal peptidase I